MMEWRDTGIIPLYNRAGVIKSHFHRPSLPGTTVETGATPEPEALADFSYKMVQHEGSGLPMRSPRSRATTTPASVQRDSLLLGRM